MRSSTGWPPQATLQQPSPRRGLWGWWLRATAPHGSPDDVMLPLNDRERLRRARLASAIIAGLMVTDLLLLPTVLDDLPSTVAVLTVLLACLAAIGLNRAGWVTAAGYVLVLILVAVVIVVFVGAPNGVARLDYFPVYDLLVVPLLVAASLLPRRQVFLVAAINCAFIISDAALQQHGFNLNTSDGYSLVAKPVGLQIIIAIVSYLWVRSTDQALRRADRAEEIAAMEHQLADQKRQLDVGIRQILDTHIRVANGDFNARAPLTQDNILFQIAASLNNLLNRLARAGQAEYLYQRTVAEIHRLRQSLEAAKTGRPPLWPMRSGTPVDDLITIIAGPGPTTTASQLPPMAAPQSGFAPGTGSIGGVGPNSGPNSGPWGMSSPSGASPEWANAGSAPWGERGPSQEWPAGADPAQNSPWDMPAVPDWPRPGDQNPRG
jgi:hypothetical protein